MTMASVVPLPAKLHLINLYMLLQPYLKYSLPHIHRLIQDLDCSERATLQRVTLAMNRGIKMLFCKSVEMCLSAKMLSTTVS